MIEGKTLNEAAAVGTEQLVEALGGLPSASMHASHLAIDVLRLVLKELTNGG